MLKLKKGDKVKIVKKILVWKTGFLENSWVDVMDKQLNKIITINVFDDYEFYYGNYAFPIECCIKINKIINKLK